MRAVLQRVTRASVSAQGTVSGEIEAGLLVFLGVSKDDALSDASYLAEKTANLRIFDHEGRMNRSLIETGGAALVVSQFTLYGDTRRGRRPSFGQAAPPEQAKTLYEEYVSRLRAIGVRVETGVFREHMSVELINNGPVIILLDSAKLL